jgi:hypothetical protein
MIGLGAAMLTNTLSFPQAFAAFSSEIPWCASAATAPSAQPQFSRCRALLRP